MPFITASRSTIWRTLPSTTIPSNPSHRIIVVYHRAPTSGGSTAAPLPGGGTTVRTGSSSAWRGSIHKGATMSKRINPYKLFVGCFLPNWLVRRQEISQGAKICYARLAQYAGDKGYAYPSQETLAGELGVCSRQVRNYLDELVKARLIDSDQQGLNSTNCYYFLTHEWMGLDDEPIENKGPEEDFHSGPEVGPEVSFHSGPEISFRSVRKYPSGRTGNILPTEENQLRDSYEERKEACEYIFRNEEPRQQDI